MVRQFLKTTLAQSTASRTRFNMNFKANIYLRAKGSLLKVVSIISYSCDSLIYHNKTLVSLKTIRHSSTNNPKLKYPKTMPLRIKPQKAR